jgi:transcriptional regulator with XRE-family HTH domain
MTKKINLAAELGADVQNVNSAVSRKLKQLRQQRRWTLDELSKCSGVSKGMLVEIEKGTANPSIAILCKVAAAFGLSVADIVNVADTPSAQLIASEDIPTLWSGPLGGSARLLAGSRGPNMIELWRWQLFPGERFESAGHPPGTCELLHVEQGELSFKVGAALLVVKPGCSAVTRADLPHYYANESTEPLVFTMAVSELHPPVTTF